MALRWDITNVDHWEEIAEDESERAVTEAVVWMMMGIDLPEITEKNLAEVVARVDLYQKLCGSLLVGPDGPVLLTVEDLARRVGLTTNVSTKTWNQFTAKLLRWEKRASQQKVERFRAATNAA